MLGKGSHEFENCQAIKILFHKDNVHVSTNVLLELQKEKKKGRGGEGREHVCRDGVNYNPGTWKAEAGGLCDQVQPELHSKPISKQNKI